MTTKAQRQKAVTAARKSAAEGHHSISARVAPSLGWSDPTSGLAADEYGIVIPRVDQVFAADRLKLRTLRTEKDLPEEETTGEEPADQDQDEDAGE